jgi:hypothetical protein
MKRPRTKKPVIVSVDMPPKDKQALDRICDIRGMTIKSVLGRLIDWFGALDKTDQAVILGQIETRDIKGLSRVNMNKPRKGRARRA